MYFADSGNNRVRRIDTEGSCTTVAGNGQAATSATAGRHSAAVWNPTGLALDDEGNLTCLSQTTTASGGSTRPARS